MRPPNDRLLLWIIGAARRHSKVRTIAARARPLDPLQKTFHPIKALTIITNGKKNRNASELGCTPPPD
jgi:hypothetical protein